MEKTGARKAAVLLIAMAIIFAAAMLVVAPKQAQAANLTSAAVSSASSATNTSFSTAQTLTMGETVSATFEDLSDYYWYKFKAKGRNLAVYRATLTYVGEGRSIAMAYFTASGGQAKWLDTDDNELLYVSATDNKCTALKLDTTAKAWYYIEINSLTAYQGEGFKLSVSEIPVLKQVTGLKAASKTKNAIKMKWTKQTNATKYQVKWRKKGGSWKTVNATSNTKAFKNLKKNTSYQFKVRAYRKGAWNASSAKASNWGPWSATKAIKTKK